jgi:hypothetical protein
MNPHQLSAISCSKGSVPGGGPEQEDADSKVLAIVLGLHERSWIISKITLWSSKML